MKLSSRAGLAELMDAPGLDPAIYERCLRDLNRVNRVTLTHRPTLRWLSHATRHLAPGASFSLLDIAYGHGDLLRLIARWAVQRGLRATLTGIDLNPRAAAAAYAVTPPDTQIDYRTGDVFAFAPGQPFDYIVTSQFTHHLPDADIIRLLRWMETNAAISWHVADLHRHWFAYYGFPLLARLLRWHPIVRHDGAASIACAFTRGDWEQLLDQAGLQADITWHPGFRYSVARRK
ncbi:methyltransferase domain-containing protein [Acidocella sp.]|uniref:methyltransferase domain-containing protein n=1 Tax=Acidocella sp. TaxID=50710 RepID=UPI00261B452E|nr:methyltransferase domain-containing protein [Acidocella sp.]